MNDCGIRPLWQSTPRPAISSPIHTLVRAIVSGPVVYQYKSIFLMSSYKLDTCKASSSQSPVLSDEPLLFTGHSNAKLDDKAPIYVSIRTDEATSSWLNHAGQHVCINRSCASRAEAPCLVYHPCSVALIATNLGQEAYMLKYLSKQNPNSSS